MTSKNLRRFYRVSWILFLVALFFRILHYPGASLLIILSTSSISTLSLLLAVSYLKTNRGLSLVHIATSVITCYVLFRLQYWPLAIALFYFGLLLSIGCILFLFIKKEPYIRQYILFIVYLVAFLLLHITPSYKIFYACSLAFSSEEKRNTDYSAWDKYSWFLYLDGKYSEATEANKKALAAANLSSSPESKPSSITIMQHGFLIQTKEWKEWSDHQHH